MTYANKCERPFLSSGHSGLTAGSPRTVLGDLDHRRAPSPHLRLFPDRGALRPPGPRTALCSPISRWAWPIGPHVPECSLCPILRERFSTLPERTIPRPSRRRLLDNLKNQVLEEAAARP